MILHLVYEVGSIVICHLEWSLQPVYRSCKSHNNFSLENSGVCEATVTNRDFCNILKPEYWSYLSAFYSFLPQWYRIKVLQPERRRESAKTQICTRLNLYFQEAAGSLEDWEQRHELKKSARGGCGASGFSSSACSAASSLLCCVRSGRGRCRLPASQASQRVGALLPRHLCSSVLLTRLFALCMCDIHLALRACSSRKRYYTHLATTAPQEKQASASDFAWPPPRVCLFVCNNCMHVLRRMNK